MKNTSLGLVLALLLSVAATQAAADEPIDPHAARLANEVAHNILSPFCPGKTLAMCPSPAAGEVRMKIQDMAAAGMDEQQIKDAVIEEHGEEFRIVEPPWIDNLGLLGVLGAGLGLALLAVVIISRRRATTPDSTSSDAPPKEPDADDPYLAELRKQYRD